MEMGARKKLILLFVASFAALFFELLLIRYLSTEIRIFAYLKNLPLVASFFGLGFGMLSNNPPRFLKKLFPFVSLLVFLPIIFAPLLNITHPPFPKDDYYVWGYLSNTNTLFSWLAYLGIVCLMTALVAAFFTVVGGFIGKYLKNLPPLRGYGVNLLGSLAGTLFFTVLSALGTEPAVWMLLGFASLLPLLFEDEGETKTKKLPIYALIAFVVIIVAAWGQRNDSNFWSPYYHVEIQPVVYSTRTRQPIIYDVSVNHDYHQRIIDLSSSTAADLKNWEFYNSALSAYNLPYEIKKGPQNVLVLGAGTGNDVAAALRNGAGHVDAVEIDPVIYELGKLYHPEKPYDSGRVSIYLEDARSFLKTTDKKYDLIVFSYIDSHTLLSSFSSIRLDNYLYTKESFVESEKLLKPGGTLYVATAGAGTFIIDRMAATLDAAFGKPPAVYFNGYDGGGVSLIEGNANSAINLPEISGMLQKVPANLIPTDNWPFLFLKGRYIPIAIWFPLLLLIIGACVSLVLKGKKQGWSLDKNRKAYHAVMLMLGVGFLLFETKAMTELSLVFGSTWIVNAVVISIFLLVGIFANYLASKNIMATKLIYPLLLLAITANVFFPYDALNAYSLPAKLGVLTIVVGLPVFLSGLLFSKLFARTNNPGPILALNLFGATAGGVLENFVMVGGLPLLRYMVFIIYLLAAIIGFGSKNIEKLEDTETL